MNIYVNSAKKISPEDIEFLEKIFKTYTDTYDYAQGIKEYGKYFKRNPHAFNEKILCRLGLMYDHLALQKPRQRKKFENKALQIYRRVARKDHHSYRAVWGIGRIWWHRGSARAIPYVLKAHTLAKKAGQKGIYTQNVGLVYESLKKYSEAEKWLLKGLQECTDDWGVYLNIINFYRSIHNFTQAKKYALQGSKIFYKKENDQFRKTPWGKKVMEIFEHAEETLPSIKKKPRVARLPKKVKKDKN